MEIIPFQYNSKEELCSNTFVVIDSKNDCVVIDPGANYDGIVNYINKRALSLKAILLTHSHFDHMRGVDILTKSFDVPLYVSKDDIEGLTNTKYNCSYYYQENVIINTKPTPIDEYFIIKHFSEDIFVISTPYHTIGSVCFYFKESKILFSGDSIFYKTVGRMDLPTSTPKDFNSSIEKILSLPEEVKIYPGHGLFTNVKNERISNSFVH